MYLYWQPIIARPLMPTKVVPGSPLPGSCGTGPRSGTPVPIPGAVIGRPPPYQSPARFCRLADILTKTDAPGSAVRSRARPASPGRGCKPWVGQTRKGFPGDTPPFHPDAARPRPAAGCGDPGLPRYRGVVTV